MLMIVPVALVLPARADVPGSPPPSGRADASDLLDPITGSATSGSFTPRYPGDAIDFYIRVTTIYSGTLFNGPDSPGNQTRINRARMSVEGFTDANKAPIANPVDWEVSTFNNAYGGGYNWSSPGNTYSLYATQTNGYFRFTIKTSNVLPGQYYLSLKVTADIMTTARYDNTLFTYVCTFDKVTNYDYVPFEVRSYVAPTSAGKYSFIGMAENGNSEPLYAGAQNQKIGFTGMYSYSGTLADITGEISFTTGSFTVVQSTSFAKQSGMNLYWRINIDKQTSPGNHNFNLRFTYTRNGVDMTEASTVQSIMVPYTPLLAFPNYNYNPKTVFTELVQNTPNATFRVPVRNDGNVDLKDVTVRLDLDNAAYFVNNDFYYSETWYSTVTYIDTAKYIGTIEAGKSIDVAFPDVPLKNNLPPGRYFIPIEYEAGYYSDGSVISSGDVISGSWDEKGYYDYTNIMQATSSPEIPVEISPGILINVVDDARGIELEGQLTST